MTVPRYDFDNATKTWTQAPYPSVIPDDLVEDGCTPDSAYEDAVYEDTLIMSPAAILHLMLFGKRPEWNRSDAEACLKAFMRNSTRTRWNGRFIRKCRRIIKTLL